MVIEMTMNEAHKIEGGNNNVDQRQVVIHVKAEQCSEKVEEVQGRTRKKGGIITMPFILVSEACDKMATDGLNKNLMNFLRKEVHMSVTKAANTLTNYNGTASLTPLLGAFLADSYAGRFWTITIASILCQIGMVLFTISAALPQLRPTCKANTMCQSLNAGQLAMLYIPLLLLALGSGGIRSCLSAFGADQLVPSGDTKQTTKFKARHFFSWYFIVMAVSMLFATTVLVYVQDNVGWVWGLGILSIAILLSTITFVLGRPIYRMLEPSGSPYTRLLQVTVAAIRKRNLPMVSDPRMLYENNELDNYSSGEKLHHSAHFKFLDRAAIATEGDFTTPNSPNLWKLGTIHRVEELKSMIRMIPIWGAGILFFMASAQENTFSIEQANTMDRHLTKSFIIPSGSMSVFKMISTLLAISLYDPIIIPLLRKYTNFNHNNSFLHRMGIGFAISIIATLVAGYVEVKRKQAVIHNGAPISVFWLVPQYALNGFAEAFLFIGHLEFFYDQAPESMRSTATALFWTSSSAGNYVSSLLVSVVHKASNWLPDNLNKGKLESFYWLITILQFINLIYYLVCAWQYTFKPVQVHCENVSSDAQVGVESLDQV